jgi:YjzC-like protein
MVDFTHTTKRLTKGVRRMGEISQFRPGDKAPNNGVYIEIGETGSSVKDPQQIELNAGEKFPDTSNENRVWKNKRNINRPSTQGRSGS